MLQKLPKNTNQSQEKFSAAMAVMAAISATKSWSRRKHSNTDCKMNN
jgi:hypothetical protein